MSWKFPHFHELEFEAVRSRGPGGQSVNKTNSSSVLRWNVLSADVPEDIKLKLLKNLRLSQVGDLIIRSDEHRDLEQNKKECIDRLKIALRKALYVQPPRKKTKPKFSAVKKRLNDKKTHAEKKDLRKRVRI